MTITRKIKRNLTTMFTHKLESARGFNLRFVVKYEGVLKVAGSHVHFKSDSVLKTVLDKDVETRVHKH